MGKETPRKEKAQTDENIYKVSQEFNLPGKLQKKPCPV